MLEDTVDRVKIGAFYQQGQSCIGVQRILIHESLYDTFKAKLLEVAKTLKHGDPKEADTWIGPVISEGEAARMESWIKEAVSRGAKVLCGGERNGTMVEATLLEDVPKDCDLYTKEFFGPAAILIKYSDFDEALDEVNNSDFGLQAGLFTRDIYKIHKAWDKLDVGGLLVGESSNWRIDHMPYGGVKDSGLGREGLRWAMEDMSEVRLLVIRTPDGV